MGIIYTNIEIRPRTGSNLWSCCRYNANNAWNANGNNGFFNNNNMYNSNGSVPLTNYKHIQMIELEDIISAYKIARKNKRKSPDQVEFELHWEMNCVKLLSDITERELRPTAYTFITEHPKPREVFASDMATRILHHYIDIHIRQLLEKRMSPHTFNNRVGMGQCACQNAVISDIYEVSKGFTKDSYIVKLDLSGCFPNISQDIAFKQLEEVVLSDYHGADKEELLYMLQVCVFSYPTHHCYSKSPLWKRKLIDKEKSIIYKPDGIGAAIGHLIWQNAVNYYFHEIDEWICDMGMKYERFVDDMLFVVNNKAFLLMIPELRQRLAALGAKLNEHKFYCQHHTKGVEWLGVHIKMDRIYPNNRIVRRACMRARAKNGHIDERHVWCTISSINSYLGICKNVNGFQQAKKIVGNLSKKWEKYFTFNTHRVCLEANPDYTMRNIIIKQFKLIRNETVRNRRKTKRAAEHC